MRTLGLVIGFSLLVTVYSWRAAYLDRHLWEEYKTQYEKRYRFEEEAQRYRNFLTNLDKILQNNRKHKLGLVSYKMGLNNMSDQSAAEMSKFHGYLGDDSNRLLRFGNKGGKIWRKPINVQIPEEVDWRKEGFVTEVKNQGFCGSCYTFSATGALEGQHKRKTGVLTSLSEQNLIDCSTNYGNMGCSGGWPHLAYQYVIQNRGIDTENGYPYQGLEGGCRFNKSSIGATAASYHQIAAGNEKALMVAVATEGPVSVAINAGLDGFKFYQTGVYYDEDCSSSLLNHAVLIVGYGKDPIGGDYWIVKNSWSTSWGEGGYIRMARNRGNHCGIASVATIPIL